MRLWPLLLLVLAALAPTASAEGIGTIHVTVCIDHGFPEERRPMHEECWMDTLQYAPVAAEGPQTHQATADFDGVAIFPDVAPGQYTLSSDATGFGIEDRVVDVVAGQRTYVVLKALSQEVAVEGKLVDSAFAPIEGAGLRFHGQSGVVNLTTDAQGAFAATMASGYHWLELNVPGLMGQKVQVFVDGTELRLMAPDEDALALRGQAVDQDGQPVPYAEIEGWSEPAWDSHQSHEPEVRDGYVVVRDPYRGGHFQAIANEDGAFEVAVNAGRGELHAWAEGYRGGWVEFHGQQDLVVTLEKLPDKDARVTGTVVDAATGEPIPDFHVQINNRVMQEWACSMPAGQAAEMERDRYRHKCDITTTPGSFEGAVMPGYSIVEVSARGHCEYSCMDAYVRHVETVVLEPGQNVFQIELHRRPAPDAAVNGYVLSEDGEPVQDASVDFHSDGSYGSARINEFGSYRVMLRPGWHQVHVWAPGFHEWQGMVQATAGKEVPLDIRLTQDPDWCCEHRYYGPYDAPPMHVARPMWINVTVDEPVMETTAAGDAEEDEIEYDSGEDFVDMGGLQEDYKEADRITQSLPGDQVSKARDSQIPALPVGLLVLGLLALGRRR